MKDRECWVDFIRRYPEDSVATDQRLAGSPLVKLGFDEPTAIAETKRCLGDIRCESCDLCRLFCPDLCITRNEKTDAIEIDYDFCKGCGICVAVCPKEAIKMVLEEYSQV